MTSRNLFLSIAIALVLAACVNTSDERMIEAAESLVPPDSEVTEMTENTGLEALVGSYSVYLTDGGAGEQLDDAIARQAESAGWMPTYEEQIPVGVRLGYVRDGVQADVSVRTKNETINAVIRVEATES